MKSRAVSAGFMGNTSSACSAMSAKETNCGSIFRKGKLVGMGELPHTAFNLHIYVIAHGFKLFVNLAVCVTYRCNPKALHKLFTFNIVMHPIFRKMLTAIQFNNKFCFRAVKISNKPAYNPLPHDTDRISTKKIVPQMAFLWRHIFSQFSGVRRKNRVHFSIMRHLFTFQYLEGTSPSVRLSAATSLILREAFSFVSIVLREAYSLAPLVI